MYNRNMTSTSIPTYIHSLLPTALHPFVSLSYPVAPTPSFPPKLRFASRIRDSTAPQQYGQGPKDVYFVIFCALAFTLLREICIRYLLSSFARRFLKKERRKSYEARGDQMRSLTKLEKRRMERTTLRFAEQGWSFIYCTVFWSLGGYILSRLQQPFSPETIWSSYPNKTLPPLTKFYYLAQLGWWFHQIYVINTEKRRNDHWQMFTHHILTITLLTGSYIAHLTRVGTIIHFLMDLCDIFLPLAKMFRYLSFSFACDLTFVIFLVAWLLSRQIGLTLVIRTCLYDAPRFIPYKWDPSQGLYFTRTTFSAFLVMLVFLLALASVWFYMAIIVAIRVVRGLGAEDSRSDDEGDDDVGDDEVADELDNVPEMASVTTIGKSNAHGAIRKRK